MHLVDYYMLVYYALVSIASVSVINKYKYRIEASNISVKNNVVFLLTVFLILMMGLRPPGDYWFADSYWYNYNYNALEGTQFDFDFNVPNLIWDNIFNFFCAKKHGISTLFLLSDILYFGCSYLACRKLFPKDTAAAYLVFLGAFSTFSFSYNGIKAGIAASIFLLALSYREKLLLCIALVLVSWGFHHSMQLPVAAFVMSLFYKNSKVYFAVWVICILLAAGHVSFFQNLFAGMSDESGASYLIGSDSDLGKSSGFRLDFILYSAMPVLVGYLAVYKKKIEITPYYKMLLNMYLITNSVWMLCMYANFTNRIAYLSWFMYPVVLIYPFLNEDWGNFKYKVFSKVMAYHLLFTLFMSLIYNRFIK